jgi:hypothetical protein
VSKVTEAVLSIEEKSTCVIAEKVSLIEVQKALADF